MMPLLIYGLMFTLIGSITTFVYFKYMVNEHTYEFEVHNAILLIVMGSILWPLTLLIAIFGGPIFLVGYLTDKARRKKD